MSSFRRKKCRSLPLRCAGRANAVCLLLSASVLCLLSLLGHLQWNQVEYAHQILQLKPLNWSGIDDQNHKTKCSFHTCFDISRCEHSMEDTIGVYIGEQYKFRSSQTSDVIYPGRSTEYAELVKAVRSSRYYVSDPTRACVYIPPVDTLSSSQVGVVAMGTILNSLPEWTNGRNFLLFNMLPGAPPTLNATPDFYYGKAMIAGAGLTPTHYRTEFDISIPAYNPLTKSQPLTDKASISDRPRLLTVVIHGGYRDVDLLSLEMGEELLLLKTECKSIAVQQLPWRRCGHLTEHVHSYPDVLLSSKFCLLLWGAGTGMLDFTDMMMTGCIPVIVDDVILPFTEVLDWTLASIRCPSCSLGQVVAKLKSLPDAMVLEWREQVLYLYRRYFSSMAAIVMTTLGILTDRVFTLSAKSYDWWNKGHELTHIARYLDFLPVPKNEGFTAVILSYNRMSSLFNVIESVSRAPSCVRILVVWNNVDVSPPSAQDWPKVRQHIEVIRSKKNKLSNRFYPYSNLTTAVLSLDDDITMLTADELEFGFKAWQEFPNRLVGFPGRVHTQLSESEGQRWKYESSWLNNISLVLTGAAFYHKYYHYLYTHEMPAGIRDWVDHHMNCEDIAMNFLISNHTGLPPLKITPRKKFVCPSCSSESSLWSDNQHYIERDECINIFEQFFGGMPLKTVKFRLDPVLYKTGTPSKLQNYPHMGDL